MPLRAGAGRSAVFYNHTGRKAVGEARSALYRRRMPPRPKRATPLRPTENVAAGAAAGRGDIKTTPTMGSLACLW